MLGSVQTVAHCMVCATTLEFANAQANLKEQIAPKGDAPSALRLVTLHRMLIQLTKTLSVREEVVAWLAPVFVTRGSLE